jgi:hypothetical protein
MKRMNVGSATLVMVFSVLCLTIFAMITLMTAHNDLTAAQKNADAVRAYYEADAEAAAILAEIRTGTVPDTVEREQGGALAYSVEIDGNQRLVVRLAEKDGKYAVEKWAVEYTGEWETDDTIEVWDGE